jgi:sulfide:quinone oxidoreductase
MTPQVLIVGGSFAGLNAAFDLKRRLGDRVDITVIDKNDRFVFIPSMIWLVPGWRTAGDITFALAPALERKGIQFVQTAADRIDAESRSVLCTDGPHRYDYLLIATGPHWDYEAIPGLGPRGDIPIRSARWPKPCPRRQPGRRSSRILDPSSWGQPPAPVALGPSTS